MAHKTDYYHILGVSPNANQSEIKKAYRDRMSQERLHPDLGGNDEMAKQLGEAYAILLNPCMRQEYDAKYREMQKKIFEKSVQSSCCRQKVRLQYGKTMGFIAILVI